MPIKITIEYCVECRFVNNAISVASEILKQFEKQIESLVIIPSPVINRFDVTLNDQVIFSKKKTGRFPLPNEVEAFIKQSLN
jgi:selenoprotein W-related protein